MKCVEVYKELYHQEPFDVAFCPYRISPLGAHIDHQYGKINGLAIDKGIHMAYHPKQNGVVELQSLNFPKRAQFFVSAVPDEKQGDWADHLRGAAKMLGEKYRLKVGLSGIIEGSLPIGGLSSSASVIICFLSALCKVNGIHLEPMEMILTAKAAENQYVGVSCGKLDQSCEVLSKKNHLLYLDTKDDSYELIPTSEKMKPYKVAIFFSGLERSLKNSKYNLRQDECKAAAYALMGYAGMDYDTFANTRLRDVPYEVFEAYKDRLPELWRRRAEHYYSEFARAERGAELWRKGDLDGYGQLVFESGKSSMEYAQMLKQQLAKGNNGLVRTKYITFSIEAKSVREAKPRLERIETDILNNFKVLGVKAYPLNGVERLQIMYETFHQEEQQKFDFSYDRILQSGMTTKDFIAPTSFLFKSGKDFMMGDTYGAASYLNILAPELTDKVLAEFLDMNMDSCLSFLRFALWLSS